VPLLVAVAALLAGCLLGGGVVAVGAIVSNLGDHRGGDRVSRFDRDGGRDGERFRPHLDDRRPGPGGERHRPDPATPPAPGSSTAPAVPAPTTSS
jgi:hypothetical protein